MPNQRFPQVEIISVSVEECRFILSKTDTSMANTLRRIMIAEVPTLAIDLVEFHSNSTVLNDEYIAHRLGLIPLKYVSVSVSASAIMKLWMDDCQDANNNNNNNTTGSTTTTYKPGLDMRDAFLPHRDCVCYERCPRCSVELELNVNYNERMKQEQQLSSSGENGENNNLAENNNNNNTSTTQFDLHAPLTVTSRDLISTSNTSIEVAHFLNQDEQDESQDSGISIVKLGPGQHLQLKAIARMGISKEHAKWCPVAVACYKFWPLIDINDEACNSLLTWEQKQELVDVCADRILELDPVTGNLQATKNAWDMATYTDDLREFQQSLKKRPEDDDFITVTPSSDKFIFTVESTGAMAAQEIVLSALRTLKDKLNYLAQEVENLKDM